ncbi:MAG: malonyl-CoA decarboxylase [Gaiellaceae bacterium]|nr:malonyl-CoA decarboxylase [Gaiellaceae bacterium]
MERQNASRPQGPRTESRTPRVVGGLLDGILERWRDLTARRARRGRRDLSDEDAERLRERIDAVLDRGGGEVSARAIAVELAATYLDLSELGRRRLLRVLARDLGVDHAAADTAAQALLAAPADARDAAERTLREALRPRRARLLAQLTTLPHGVRFLVDLRADALRAARDAPHLQPLADDLLDQLRALFDVGLLELERVTWDSPASLLEKLARYEAVHDVASWADLKNRLDRDRRMFAFFHPSMPDEPLIFVEVALTRGLAGEIAPLLEVDAPPDDPARADTAIFYSISSAQEGLAGVGFGGFLIKRVVDELRAELPRLRTFATLSPIPGFARWLARELGPEGHERLTGDERRSLAALGGVEVFDEKALLTRLADPAWSIDEALASALSRPLLRLCAAYLLTARRRDLGALDPVAAFHLGNGARVERLHWLGDPSPKGIAQSHGLMVNYLYRLEWIEENHEAYTARGEVRAASDVLRLIEPARGDKGSKAAP